MSAEQHEAIERLIKTLEKLHHRLMTRVDHLRRGAKTLPATSLRGARQILDNELTILDGAVRIREALDLGGADHDSLAHLDAAIDQASAAADWVRNLLLYRDADRLVAEMLALGDPEEAWSSLDDAEGGWAVERLKQIAAEAGQ